MRIDVSRIYFPKLQKADVIAYVDIIIEKELLLKGFKVIRKNQNIFICMPSKLNKIGTWINTVALLNKQLDKTLTNLILKAMEIRTQEKLYDTMES